MNEVIFCSVTPSKNTRKLAEAVARGAGVSAKSISQAGEIRGVDTLFVGASLYAGRINDKLREFLSKIAPGEVRRVIVFGTAAGDDNALGEIRELFAGKDTEVSGEGFFCRGSFLLMNRKRPNAEDLARAEAFAKNSLGL